MGAEDEEQKVRAGYRASTIEAMIKLCPDLTQQEAENLYGDDDDGFDDGLPARDYAIEILRAGQD